MAASPTDLQRLIVSLEAKLDKYDRAMAKAAGSTDRTLGRIEKRFKKAENAIGNFGRGFVQGIVGTATLQGLGTLIDGVAELADQAKRAGVSAEQLQKFGVAAARSGSSMAAVVDLMKVFNLQLGKAQTEGGPLAKLFAANNIPLKDQNGLLRNNVEMFMEMLDLIKDARSPQERMVVAQLAFKKLAGESIDFLQQGSQSLKDIGREAEAAGGIIQDKLVDSADRLADRWHEAWGRASNEGASALLALIDKAQELDRAVQRAFAPVRAFLGTHNDFDVGGQRNSPEGGNMSAFSKGTIVPSSPTNGGKPSPIAAPFVEARPDIDRFIKQMDEARDSTREFVGDLVHGLKEGQKLTDVLSSAFERLADKMIDKLLDQGVDALFGASGGQATGILGQALGIAAPGMGALNISRNPFDTQRGNAGEPDWVSSRQIGGKGPHLTDPHMGASLGSFAGIEGAPEYIPPQAAPGTAQQEVWDFWKSKGLSDNQVAGIMGNVKQESQFDPAAWGDNHKAYGLYQFGPARNKGLFAKYGTNPTVAQQNEYAYSQATGGDPQASVAFARLQNAGSIREATGIWGAGFERPQGASLSNPEAMNGWTNRLQGAQEAAQQFGGAVKQVAETAKTAATGFAGNFTPAVQNILDIMNRIPGGLQTGGAVASLFAGRAAGGPVSAHTPYIVGEHGPEFFMPRTPGIIIPNHRLGGGNAGQIQVHVTKSPYFDAHVERIAAGGDRQTLNTARRNLPDTQARFAKLGTTSR